MGGNIAGGLSVLNNIEGVTFNPYGNLDKILQQKADDLGQEIEINPEKLINYRHEKDWISNSNNIGSNQELNEKNISQNPFKNIIDNKIFPHLTPNIPNVEEDNFGRYEIQNEKIIYYPKLSKIK